MIHVLFVCLGNICRSPMAEAVFRKIVNEQGLSEAISVDSAGTGDWHVGERPHSGTLSVLDQYQIPHEWLRSRQITREDLNTFDYVIAMDSRNLEGIKGVQSTISGQVLRLLDLVEDEQIKDVPDPYFTGNFDAVYQLVTRGCERLLEKIKFECDL